VPIGHRRRGDDRLADLVDVAARRQVHHRVRAVVDGRVELLELRLDVGRHGGVADVRVDLAGEPMPMPIGSSFCLEVVDVRGDDRAALGHLAPDELRDPSPSRSATRRISGVTSPSRARCICVTFAAM
jgi:hypothetical protein